MEVMIVLLGLGLIVGMVLGIWWLIWSLWCWVVPQLWVGGPDQWLHPDYWLFAGAWLLLGLVGRMIFGGRSKKGD